MRLEAVLCLLLCIEGLNSEDITSKLLKQAADSLANPVQDILGNLSNTSTKCKVYKLKMKLPANYRSI